MSVFGGKVTQSVAFQVGDPVTLQLLIQRAIAGQVIDHGVSQLIDAYLAGGGAGGVWLMTLLFSTVEAGNFPNLADQNVRVFWALDAATIAAKVTAFWAEVPAAIATFMDSAAGGAGATWITVLIYETNESGGAPSLLSASRGVDDLYSEDIVQLTDEGAAIALEAHEALVREDRARRVLLKRGKGIDAHRGKRAAVKRRREE